MGPRDLPDGAVVALEVRDVLTLAAIDDVVDLDGAVRRAGRQLLAVVVQLHVVLWHAGRASRRSQAAAPVLLQKGLTSRAGCQARQAV
eukprot:7284350-Prymnesium_polylepis.3